MTFDLWGTNCRLPFNGSIPKQRLHFVTRANQYHILAVFYTVWNDRVKLISSTNIDNVCHFMVVSWQYFILNCTHYAFCLHDFVFPVQETLWGPRQRLCCRADVQWANVTVKIKNLQRLNLSPVSFNKSFCQVALIKAFAR